MSEASFEPGVDPSRRTWIAITCGAGAVGGAAVAVPFVSTFAPSERARAAGAAVQVDISALQPGEKMTVEWRGKPVWIVRRTPAQLEALKKTESQLADPLSARTALPNPDYAKNAHRSIKPEYFVGIGICPHLGCSPSDKFQAVKFMLADMQTQTNAAELLALRAAFLKESKVPFTREASMAKLFASETSNRVADRAVQIHGGYGYIDEFPVERYLRDARVQTIYEGTSEIQRIVIARELIKQLG